MKRTVTKKELIDTQRSYIFRTKCEPIRYKMIELARLTGIRRSTQTFGPTYKEIQEIFTNEFDQLHTIAKKLDGYVYSWRKDKLQTQHDKDILKNEVN